MSGPSPAHPIPMLAVIAASVTASCVPVAAPSTKEAAPPVHLRSAHAFAIYEDDVEHDLTNGLGDLPAGFHPLHEPSPPYLGYVHAALEGVPQTTMMERVHAWSATGVVPLGARLLLGRTPRDAGVRTYLVRFRAVVDATDIAGATVGYATKDSAEVMLSFEPPAMDRLARALSKPKARARLVVLDLVEEDTFELVSRESWQTGRIPHGTHWKSRFCSDHIAILKMDAPSDASPKARAEALVAELPRGRSVEVCSDGP